MWSEQHGGLAALQALLADDAPMPPELLALLRAGIRTYLRHAGRLTLDRALRLPTRTETLRLQRNDFIKAALRQIAGPSDRARAIELRRMLVLMASNGCFRRWRVLDGIPAYATALQRAAFEILSCGPDPTVPAVPCDRLLRALARDTA